MRVQHQILCGKDDSDEKDTLKIHPSTTIITKDI